MFGSATYYYTCYKIENAVVKSHLQLRKTLPHYQRPQIIQDAEGDQPQPIEVKVLIGVDHSTGRSHFASPLPVC